MPDSPEYKRWRRIWWILILSALVTLLLSFLLSSKSIVAAWAPFQYISYACELIAIVLLVIVWILDFKKIRPITKQAQQEALSQSNKKK